MKEIVIIITHQDGTKEIIKTGQKTTDTAQIKVVKQ